MDVDPVMMNPVMGSEDEDAPGRLQERCGCSHFGLVNYRSELTDHRSDEPVFTKNTKNTSGYTAGR